MLLDRQNSPYSQLLATTTLTKLISRTAQVLSLQQRIDIRKFCQIIFFFKLKFWQQFFIYITGNYVLNYLYNQPKLAQFVIQGLVTLFARITNLGWFDSKDDDFVFRNVIGDITKFLQGQQADHCMIGVQLLSQLTCEMNQVSIKNNCNFVNFSQNTKVLTFRSTVILRLKRFSIVRIPIARFFEVTQKNSHSAFV